MIKQLFKITVLIIAPFLLASCGGGGGGGSDFSPLDGAIVSLDVSDDTVELGDRLQAFIYVSDLSNQAALIKIRYPDSLRYIKNTARLRVGDSAPFISPVVGPSRSSEDQHYYLVFDITKKQLAEYEKGIITIQFRAESQDLEANIEIDTDMHEANKLVRDLFNIDSPLFSAKDSWMIEIR